MRENAVLFKSEDGRWVELSVKAGGATAKVGGPNGTGEPFLFNAENLGYVLGGIGYQAWGGGSHFVVRRDRGGFAVEFQGPSDRSAAVCRLSRDAMIEKLGELDPSARVERRAVVV